MVALWGRTASCAPVANRRIFYRFVRKWLRFADSNRVALLACLSWVRFAKAPNRRAGALRLGSFRQTPNSCTLVSSRNCPRALQRVVLHVHKFRSCSNVWRPSVPARKLMVAFDKEDR